MQNFFSRVFCEFVRAIFVLTSCWLLFLGHRIKMIVVFLLFFRVCVSSLQTFAQNVQQKRSNPVFQKRLCYIKNLLKVDHLILYK